MSIVGLLWAAALPLGGWTWFCEERPLVGSGDSVPASVCAAAPWLAQPGALPTRARSRGSSWVPPEVQRVELAILDGRTGKPVPEGWIEVPEAPPALFRVRWSQAEGPVRLWASLPVKVRIGADGFKAKESTLREAHLTVTLTGEQEVVWRLARPMPADACLAAESELGTFATFAARASCVEAGKDGTIRLAAPRDARAVVVVRAEGCRPQVIRGVLPSGFIVPCEQGLSLPFLVLDSDKRPVPAAKVTVTGSVPGLGSFAYRASCLTAETGTCTVQGLEEGLVQVGISASGKAFWAGELSLPHQEPVVATLERGWDLQGRVLSAGGEPLAAATVRAEGAETRSDQRGRFLLSGLPFRTCLVRADAASFLPQEVAVEPGTSELVLRLLPGARVELPVKGPLGEGVMAEATLRDGEEVKEAFAGKVREEPPTIWWEGLPPGTYRLEVRVPGFVPLSLQALVGEPGAVVRLPEASLDPGRSFTGTVVDRSTAQPVVGAQVRAEPGDADEYRPPLEVLRAARTLTRPDGSFLLAGLADLPYRLVIQAPGFAPLVLSGQKPRPEGADLGTLELGRGFRLQVRVVDSQRQPRNGLKVELREGKPYEYEPVFSGVTDEKGTAEFPNVPVGRFRLDVSGEGCERHQWVEGGEGERKEVTVLCAHPRVRGTVLVGGVPVSGGRVVLAVPEVERKGPVVMVDRPGEKPQFFGVGQASLAAAVSPQGEFLLDPATPGAWQARWVFQEQSTSPLQVLVPEEGELVVVLDFPGGGVRGLVRDDKGVGVGQAAVDLLSPAGETLAVGQSDFGGRFVFRGIGAGAAVLHVRKEGFQPVRSQVVVPDRGEVEVEIVLSAETPTGVRGTVVAPGASVAGAPVVLCGAAARVLWADAQGRFEIEGLEPGQYQLCGKAYGGSVGCTGSFSLSQGEVHTVELRLEGQAWIRREIERGPERLLLFSELSCPLDWLLPEPQWERGTLLWGPLLPGRYTLLVPPGLRYWVEAQ